MNWTEKQRTATLACLQNGKRRETFLMLSTKAPFLFPLPNSCLALQLVYFSNGWVLPVSVNLLAALKGSAIMPGSVGTL